MFKRPIILLFVVFILGLLTVGCGNNETSSKDESEDNNTSQESSDKNYNITIAGASPSGFFSVMTEGYANIVREEIPSVQIGVEPGDIASGIAMLDQEERDVSWAQLPEAIAAFEGREPFTSPLELKALFTVYADNPFQFVMDKKFAEKYNIESLKDIGEQKPPIRMGVNAKGVLTEAVFNDLINELGYNYDDVKEWGGSIFHTNVKSATEEMQDGKIDFFAMPVFAPDANIIALANHRDLKVIGIGDDVIMEKVANDWKLDTTTVKSGVYDFHEGDVDTVAISGVALVRPDTSEEMAYDLTKVFFEQFDKYTALHQSLGGLTKERAAESPIPLHPGAEKYLKEAGLLND